MSSNLAKKVEGILLSGWGEEIALGALSSLFDDISVADAYTYIKEDKSIIPSDMSEFKRMASRVNVDKILNIHKVLDILSKYNPEVASVILNHPNGMAWLRKQIQLARNKLDLVTP